MNEKNFSRIGGATSLTDLFKKAASSTAANVNVATLCTVKTLSWDEDKNYGIATVAPIPPLGKDMNEIEAYYFSDSFEPGGYALTVFTDTDFRPVLKNKSVNQITTNQTVHSRMFGILVKL